MKSLVLPQGRLARPRGGDVVSASAASESLGPILDEPGNVVSVHNFSQEYRTNQRMTRALPGMLALRSPRNWRVRDVQLSGRWELAIGPAPLAGATWSQTFGALAPLLASYGACRNTVSEMPT